MPDDRNPSAVFAADPIVLSNVAAPCSVKYSSTKPYLAQPRVWYNRNSTSGLAFVPPYTVVNAVNSKQLYAKSTNMVYSILQTALAKIKTKAKRAVSPSCTFLNIREFILFFLSWVNPARTTPNDEAVK